MQWKVKDGQMCWEVPVTDRFILEDFMCKKGERKYVQMDLKAEVCPNVMQAEGCPNVPGSPCHR